MPYLIGQWPKDINSYHHYQSGGVFMCDKSTQTAEDWENIVEKRKSKGHRRSASFGHGDPLKKELIKQRLQKTKEGSKYSDPSKLRLSPVPGNHSALSLTAPPTVFAQTKQLIIPFSSHIPRHSNMNRFQRNSVEGLNVEIEKLVLSKPTSTQGQDVEELDLIPKAPEIPDGHRAPIPEITRLSCTRSVDTQTPSGQTEETRPASCGSRPDSLSPAVIGTPSLCPPSELLRPKSRSDSLDSKSSKGEAEYAQESPQPSKFDSSPKLEKSCSPFVRQPPDGCEKVKVIEETRRPSIKEPLLFCPVKPNQFVFKPSQSSAFCPLYKSYLAETELLRSSSGPISVPSNIPQTPSVEGQ